MVSFELSEDQRLLKDSLASFASEQIRPLARDADEAAATPDSMAQKAWQLGLVSSAIPESFGGYGEERSAVTGAIALEELAYGDLSLTLHALAPRLLLYPVIDHGTEEQKRRILPAFAGNEFRAGGAAVIEPYLDFDLASLRTTFRQDGGDWVLSGKKAYVPLAAASDTLLVYARAANATNGDAAKSVQAFLVDRGTKGVTISEPEKNMGIKALATHEVDLGEVRLPADGRLGGEAGIDFTRLTNLSRVALGALAVGVARAAFDYARDYAKERKAFGVAIAQKQAIAFMLAEMAIEIDATRLLVWEAAWRLDRREEATREAYLAKNYAASMVLKVADDAVQVLGGHGYIRDHLVELFLRNARGFATFEGLAIV